MKSATSIGAFFDLDGTLLPRPSLEWRFIAHLSKLGEISAANLLPWVWLSARRLLQAPQKAISNKMYLARLPESLASEWADSPAGESIKFLQEGLDHISWHIGEGHRIAFVSGTLAPLARAVARRLAIDADVIATNLEVAGDRWTGRLAGPHMSDRQKANAVLGFAKQHALRLEQSYAYGDRISDLPMLESVGHPFAVNPDLRLERVARLRAWAICNWRFVSEPALDLRRRSLPIKGAA